MAAGAALLAMLDILLCHAQQLQLFFEKKAGYEYDKFGTAARTSVRSPAALLQLSNVLLCVAQQDINIQLDKNGNAGYELLCQIDFLLPCRIFL
jgi:hypothetical protein